MLFKCKMCGGELELSAGASVAECLCCGSAQTVPRLDDEKRANMYDRANHVRRNHEYDKAMELFERILEEEPTDCEAYWSLILCKYGIDYVEDSKTHKRVPTVNRAQLTAVAADEDYKSTLEYADAAQREIYEAEAKAIDNIQKGILEISQKEEPFDVFICYKEADSEGRRTPDSVLAAELYHELTEEGFKVFFSRITLEDKLGQEYEPYIFAALNSAKVMVVLGTKSEYFNAPWVKNEWARFLALIKNGAKKTIIPAYRDMDPYDLPDDFSHLQAQDMSKLGFMQDLIRGIKKIIGEEEPVTAANNVQTGANVVALKKRGFMALEDGDWQRADSFFEDALNRDAEDAECYLGKLMIELGVTTPEKLCESPRPLKEYRDFERALKFAGPELKEKLLSFEKAVQDNLTEQIFQRGMQLYGEKAYKRAVETLTPIREYKNSAEIIDICQRERAGIKEREIEAANRELSAVEEKITGLNSQLENLNKRLPDKPEPHPLKKAVKITDGILIIIFVILEIECWIENTGLFDKIAAGIVMAVILLVIMAVIESIVNGIAEKADKERKKKYDESERAVSAEIRDVGNKLRECETEREKIKNRINKINEM